MTTEQAFAALAAEYAANDARTTAATEKALTSALGTAWWALAVEGGFLGLWVDGVRRHIVALPIDPASLSETQKRENFGPGNI
jgi:hypothetical protein